ncbi:MAG: diguanylate cyclase [Pyrinomonadaceae bacterium]|jgi:diguanylate cyclase (GGDEF)-like protein
MNPEQKKKGKFLDRVASETGVALVVLDADGRQAAAANNNSICRLLYDSKEFGPACARDCGSAFRRVFSAGKAIEFECHAGLHCRAVPVVEKRKKYVVIIGRTFLKAENYRKATERAISGDWKQFKPTEFFENILISGSRTGIDKASARIEALAARRAAAEPKEILEMPEPAGQEPHKTPEITIRPESTALSKSAAKHYPEEKESGRVEAAEAAAWRSLFGSLMKLNYPAAVEAFLEFVSHRFSLESVVWFDIKNCEFHPALAIGRLRGRHLKLGIKPGDRRLQDYVGSERAYKLLERPGKEPAAAGGILNVFPVTVGGEIRGALAIEGELPKIETVRRISRLAQAAAPQLEILRLRDEVARRDWLARSVRQFNESLKRIDADDFWTHVTQVSAELLQAERASLLVKKEGTDKLQARAAIGARVNLFAEPEVGGRISKTALEKGTPIVVSDITGTPLGRAPIDWNYRTQSFISYPIVIGERRLAVLNFTDKATGEAFGETDLELLNAIAPQIAVAIDRTALKSKAGEFEQLSVTDPLTGLLNRRYLQNRLAEELNRSKRHRFPMTLMMIDVDRFKSYNDTFGHPAGDEALRIVAGILKENLRGADVAARYGGEEFAVLLPQTTVEEAVQIAERIRRQIERCSFPHRRVTASIGIASSGPDISTPDDLIWAADRALYQAKELGRNMVRVFDGNGDPLGNNVH